MLIAPQELNTAVLSLEGSGSDLVGSWCRGGIRYQGDKVSPGNMKKHGIVGLAGRVKGKANSGVDRDGVQGTVRREKHKHAVVVWGITETTSSGSELQ